MAATKPVELGPFQTIYDSDDEGVIRKELIIYRKVGDRVLRETAVREYHRESDYHDSLIVTPIYYGDKDG